MNLNTHSSFKLFRFRGLPVPGARARVDGRQLIFTLLQTIMRIYFDNLVMKLFCLRLLGSESNNFIPKLILCEQYHSYRGYEHNPSDS